MNTSDRSPKANAIALLVVGLVALIGGGMFENVVVVVIGVIALVGASIYLKIATDQAKAAGDDPAA